MSDIGSKLMLCRNPYSSNGGLYGCGQCMHCRYNKRRIWMHRIMLEAAQYEDNAFVTLTYDDEALPGLSLVPSDMQLFLKRLRAAVEPIRFRFFGVGEYGDASERPHFHLMLFGFKTCLLGMTAYDKLGNAVCCEQCRLVQKHWGKGRIQLAICENDSAGYISGYVTKKMTHKDDPRLKGRHPEFARMSRRPGLAYDALWDLADALMRYELEEANNGDVNNTLRHGVKQLPMGRYMQRKLRLMVGKDEKIPQAAFDAIQAEMRELREAARNDKENPSVKSHYLMDKEGLFLSREGKERLWRSRKSL